MSEKFILIMHRRQKFWDLRNFYLGTLLLQVIDPSLYVAKLEDTQGIEEANVSK